MPKTKEQKNVIIEEVKDKVSRAKSIYFAKFNRLGVNENQELRQQLKDNGSEYYVAKKTLLNLVLAEKKIADWEAAQLDGRLAAIFNYDDEVSSAKIITKFVKDHQIMEGAAEDSKDKLEFVGGVLENKHINAAQVYVLATLPGQTELYAKLVGSINAPVSGFVNVLAGNLRSLLYTLKAIEANK